MGGVIMKKIIVFIAAIVLPVAAFAQLKTSYFMEGAYTRTDMNPALAPTRGYFSLPGMGGVYASMGSNFLSVDNFFYRKNDQTVLFLNNQVTASEFLNKIPSSPKQNLDARVSLFGVGFHSKYMYWNFGANVRIDQSMTLDKDIFTVLKTLGNDDYDLGNTKISSQAFTEIYLGVAVPIKKFITVGGRLKGLIGLANVQANANSMTASVQSNMVKADLQGSFRGCGMIFNTAEAIPGEKLNGDLFYSKASDMFKNLGSWGLGVDLGAEVRLFDNRFSASFGLTDLGFIKWASKSAINGTLDGKFEYKSTNLNQTSKVSTDSSFDAKFTPSEGGYTTRLTTGMNIGVSYSVLRNHIVFGLLSHTKFYKEFTSEELVANVLFNAGDIFTFALSHTFLNHNRAGIFGAAINFHPAGFNLMLGMDFIPGKYVKTSSVAVPRYAKSFNCYLGIGFNLGRSKYMTNWKKSKSK